MLLLKLFLTKQKIKQQEFPKICTYINLLRAYIYALEYKLNNKDAPHPKLVKEALVFTFSQNTFFFLS